MLSCYWGETMNCFLEKDCYGIPEIYYSVAETTTCRSYNVGDIVFVPKFKYEDGSNGINHLFVIIEKNNYAIPLDYFCLLISSNIKKLRYSYQYIQKIILFIITCRKSS